MNQNTATVYNGIANVIFNQGHFEDALNLHLKSLSILEKVLDSNHMKIAGAYNGIGLDYFRLGDISKALKYYYKALPIFENSENYEMIVTIHSNIGQICFLKENFSEALEWCHKVLPICENVLYCKRAQISQFPDRYYAAACKNLSRLTGVFENSWNFNAIKVFTLCFLTVLTSPRQFTIDDSNSLAVL